MRPLASLRRPEYTGSNRCTPCTVVNLVLAVLLSVALGAALWTVSSTVGAVSASVVFLIAVALIWLRGYLVPGTPELTKRYMPPWLLAWFGKAPAGEHSETGETDTDVDIEALFLDAGVLEPCDDVDDLCLTERFDRAWSAAIDDLEADVDTDTVLSTLRMNDGSVTVERFDEGVALRTNGYELGRWPSQTAMRVDVAAGRVLDDWLPAWDRLSSDERAAVLSGLRLFLPECPDGGAVELRTETVSSCCTSYDVVAAVCTSSGDRLFEQRTP